MSEGPQIKRKAEWLHWSLGGRTVIECTTSRPALEEAAQKLTGVMAKRVFSKGKHLFFEFADGLYLHNRVLMKGKWRKLDGRLVVLPPDAWLALYVGPHTICNLNGQVLRLVDEKQVDATIAALGPDVMDVPLPEAAIKKAIHRSNLPVAEAILDQSIISGVGNIAKSEALFVAGIDPHTPACWLDDEKLTMLARAISQVCWQSYHNGGRWNCRVCRRRGKPCESCGGKIDLIRLPPSQRSTYFCPSCQVGATR